MRLVIDSNIFIAALLREGTIRKMIVNFSGELIMPEIVFDEIEEHRKELMNKASFNDKEFEDMKLYLSKYFKIVSTSSLLPFANEAEKIMKKIDEDDVLFVAASLTCGSCPIWSDDAHFKKQKEILIYSTTELIEYLEKRASMNDGVE